MSLKCHCITCGIPTNHEALYSLGTKGEPTEFAISFQVIQCRGCDSKSFRYSDRDPLNGFTNDGGEYDFLEKEHLFPPRHMSRKPVDLYWVTPDVRRVYREVHRALRNEIRTLAAIGIRLTVERLCVHKKAEGNNLAKKIEDLRKKGIITEAQMQGLHGHRFLGNDAAHDAAEPDDQELKVAMDVLDSVLESVYILPARRKRMASKRRQRKQ